MEIYTDAPKFDQTTGKPDGTRRVWKETRCDYSGQVVSSSEDENLIGWECRIVLDYGPQDPCFGSGGEEFAFGKKYGIDVYDFLSGGYVVYCNYEDDDHTATMQAFMRELPKYGTFASALRAMRIATATKLIESGEIKAGDLRRS